MQMIRLLIERNFLRFSRFKRMQAISNDFSSASYCVNWVSSLHSVRKKWNSWNIQEAKTVALVVVKNERNIFSRHHCFRVERTTIEQYRMWSESSLFWLAVIYQSFSLFMLYGEHMPREKERAYLVSSTVPCSI
jgi:hypothetical protein